MGEQAPQNLQQEMEATIAGAKEVGHTSKFGQLEITTDGEARGDAHQISVDSFSSATDYGSVVEKRTPSTKMEYRADLTTRESGRENGSLSVVRTNKETGETYEHRFDNPDVARKFITKVGGQIIERSKNADSELPKAA